jgi:hypothetical protein
VIREDRKLLAELARLNTAIAPLAMRIMDGTASTVEQTHYAQRLTAVGKRLRRRADEAAGTVIEGEVFANGPLTLPAHTVEPRWSREQLLGNAESATGETLGHPAYRATQGEARTAHHTTNPTMVFLVEAEAARESAPSGGARAARSLLAPLYATKIAAGTITLPGFAQRSSAAI